MRDYERLTIRSKVTTLEEACAFNLLRFVVGFVARFVVRFVVPSRDPGRNVSSSNLPLCLARRGGTYGLERRRRSDLSLLFSLGDNAH